MVKESFYKDLDLEISTCENVEDIKIILHKLLSEIEYLETIKKDNDNKHKKDE